MSVAIIVREPQDQSFINVNEPGEVHWWSVKLAVTPEDVHAAVGEVGPSADEVAAKLRAAAKIAFRNGGED